MLAYLLVISIICGFIRMSPTMVGGKLANCYECVGKSAMKNINVFSL
jgi:hypothetical protein